MTDDEAAVRELFARLGSGGNPTVDERDRIGVAMWAEADELGDSTFDATTPLAFDIGGQTGTGREPDTEQRPVDLAGRRPQRVLLWAAVLLVVLGAYGVANRTITASSGTAEQSDERRTALDLGGVLVEFDTLQHYEPVFQGSELVTFTAGPESTRGHWRITLTHPQQAFAGMEPEEFFSQSSLDFESSPAQPGSQVWNGAVRKESGCAVLEPCVPIAVLADGSSLSLEVGKFYQIAVYPVADEAPVLVVSEVGSPSLGPAFENFEVVN